MRTSYQPVIYLDPPPNARLAFAWGVVLGLGVMGLLTWLVLVLP